MIVILRRVTSANTAVVREPTRSCMPIAVFIAYPFIIARSAYIFLASSANTIVGRRRSAAVFTWACLSVCFK